MNNRLKYAALSVALVLALTAWFERPAYAYIDPGSGLLTLQTLGAVFTGILFYLRRRLRSLLKRTPAKDPEKTNLETTADPRR